MWTIDNNSVLNYLNVCDNASKDANVFSNFKSIRAYSCIVTGQSQEQGRQYLQKLKEKNSFLLEDVNLKKAKRGDSIGNPCTWNYEMLGNISANVIRYMSVLQELIDTFGSLDNLKIVEIGGGFGGQCCMINDFYKVKSYEIIDVPQVLKLEQRYLETMNHNEVKLTSCYDVNNFNDNFDLLISNYGISELDKDTQDLYIEKLIKKSKMGYVTYNYLKKDINRNKPYSDVEFKEIVKSLGFSVKSYNENVIRSECEVIIWKNDEF